MKCLLQGIQKPCKESTISNVMQVVEEFMAASFALRRAELLQKSLDVKEIGRKYPFLMNTAQVRLYIMLQQPM